MLKIIVAMDHYRGIGIKNHLPWSNKEDLKEFKRITLGHSVIMGRKTLDSIGKALPGRVNYVLSHQSSLSYENITMVHDIDSFFSMKKNSPDIVYVIGGASLYERALKYVDELIISEVEGEYSCDTFFPNFSETEFQLVSQMQYIGFIQKRYERSIQ